MWRIHKVTKEDNDMVKNIEGEFGLLIDKDELKTYDDIKDKFKNFKLDEEYEMELKDEGCESITYLRFFLSNGIEDEYLFLIKLEVFSMTDLKYELISRFLEEEEDKLNKIYEIYQFFYLIKIKYETKFFKFQRFENEENENEEDEDEDEDEKPIPEIQRSFPSDHCIICYTEKPNILNFPCLHICQCEDCEEMGRFTKCSICRKEIQQKILIWQN